MSPSIALNLAFAAGVAFAFAIVRIELKSFKYSNSSICAIVSLIHHIIATFYSLYANSSYIIALHNAFLLNDIEDCSILYLSTQQSYHVGIFAIVYFIFDTIFDPEVIKNKLLLFHHINGIVLIAIALYNGKGVYVAYVAHVMEFSSIFLSLKVILKDNGYSNILKLANDMIFAVVFLLSRAYLTVSNALLTYSLYKTNCLDGGSIDILVVYTGVLFVVLTTFWSFGIVKKIWGTIFVKNTKKH